MAEWKEFTGNSEQIQEMRNCYGGFLLKSSDHMYENEIIYPEDSNFSCIDAFNVTHYLICEPHLLASMIRQQALTGQPVWITMAEHTYWTSRLYEYAVKFTKDGKVVIKSWYPNWNIPSAEYSFHPCDGWVES